MAPTMLQVSREIFYFYLLCSNGILTVFHFVHLLCCCFITVSENVGYDIIGMGYFLEDGVEQFNTISYNLAAHVHMLEDIPTGNSQNTPTYEQSSSLIWPVDVSASGFYISNVHNYLIGNAASGGWSGFAFPSLPTAVGKSKDTPDFRPSNLVALEIDGNTAHSTGFWFKGAAGFYIGGALYYDSDGKLWYNPGRSKEADHKRDPCLVNQCAEPYNKCNYGCPENKKAAFEISNTKSFLIAGAGLNSWGGRIEIAGFESYDSRLALQALSEGFWMDNALVVCRTGVSLGLPAPAEANELEGSGFYWYDTLQSHIVTNAEFRNCGYRSSKYAQYDASPTRGCGDDADAGCSSSSTVFGLVTHSDQMTPEVMQGTKSITYNDCGRRFRFTVDADELDTVSGRGQNWLDVDGSASGLGVPVIIGSGFESVKDWWGVDDEGETLMAEKLMLNGSS